MSRVTSDVTVRLLKRNKAWLTLYDLLIVTSEQRLKAQGVRVRRHAGDAGGDQQPRGGAGGGAAAGRARAQCHQRDRLPGGPDLPHNLIRAGVPVQAQHLHCGGRHPRMHILIDTM